jgi:hypothetical protein
MKAELVTTGPKDTDALMSALERFEAMLINSPSDEQYVERTPSGTHTLRWANPFVNTIAAAAIAVAPAGAPTGAQRIYEYRRVVETQVTTVRYEFEQWFGDDHEYLDPVPALISSADIEDLKALLEIPYVGDQRH